MRARFALLLTLLLSLFVDVTLPASEPPGGHAVEMTFLKANPGKREQLVAFLKANWLAMDEKAVRAGLMKSYQLLDSADESEPWNVAVVVTYHNAAGYEGVAEAFEKIRQAHAKVLIEGADLRELGRVVGSKKLYARASGPT